MDTYNMETEIQKIQYGAQDYMVTRKQSCD